LIVDGSGAARIWTGVTEMYLFSFNKSFLTFLIKRIHVSEILNPYSDVFNDMRLTKQQYTVLKEEFDDDYLPFDHGFLKIVTRKIRARNPPYLESRELWQIDAWKNGSRNYHRIENNNDKDVERVTRQALSIANKDVKKSISILVDELEGVGIPVASAILYFTFPDKFAVIDRYAWNAYRAIGKGERIVDWTKTFTGGPKEYEEFCTFCRDKAGQLGAGWTPRDVEKALFFYGENKGKIPSASRVP